MLKKFIVFSLIIELTIALFFTFTACEIDGVSENGGVIIAYNISGTVSDSDTGSGLEGVTITLSGDASDSTNTDASGSYSFSGLTNGRYMVTPSLTKYSFEPTSSEVIVSEADVSKVDFVGTAEVSNTYSISGTVTDSDTGFGLEGVTMTLSGDASDSTNTDASGSYSFSGLTNGSYIVTPNLANSAFAPICREVIISGADVTNFDFVGTAKFMPRLHVDGKNIVNESGKEQILRGVAVIDPFFMKEVYKNGPSEADFKTLAEEWNVDIVRVPIHPDLWLQNENYLKEYVDPIVNYARIYGFYAFLGYHAHGNPITNEVDLPDWRFVFPWTGNPYNPDLDVAIDALTKMVERYKNDPGVLYGTFNEPSFITWQQWRPIAENLVDVIHSIESKAVVFVSGVDSGYDLSQVINDPVNRPNVIYETHPYPWKGEAWKNDVPILSEHYPVFIGEWGFGSSGGGDVDSYGKPLLDLAEQLELGWTAWVWNPEWSPSMLAADGTLTDFGTLVKEALTNK